MDIDTVIKLRTNGLLLDGILVRFCFGTRGRTIASGPPQVHLFTLLWMYGPPSERRGSRTRLCDDAGRWRGPLLEVVVVYLVLLELQSTCTGRGLWYSRSHWHSRTAAFLVFMLFARLRQMSVKLPGYCPHPELSRVWVRTLSSPSLTSPWYVSLSRGTFSRHSWETRDHHLVGLNPPQDGEEFSSRSWIPRRRSA